MLERAAVKEDLSLRLEDGRMVQIVVRGHATDKDYICVGVDGDVPGF